MDHEDLGQLEVGVNYFEYSRNKSTGGISDRFVDLNGKSRLGYEVDWYTTWRPFSDISFTLQFGLFFPNSRAFLNDSNRHYVSVGTVFYF